MRAVCISDTHSLHRYIDMPAGDILIHAGDFTKNGRLEAVKDFNDWLGELDFKAIICIAGNHDLSFQRTPELVKPLLTNCTYLEDSWTVIEGIKFFGSPWSTRFGNWAFMKDSDQMARHWPKLPDDIDVLITHGPAYGILDQVESGEEVGCVYLRKWLQENESVRLCVTGHVHEAYGTLSFPNRTHINPSICNLEYQPVNPPIVIDI